VTGHAADVDRIDDHGEDRPLRLHSPPHPGRIVRQECLEPLGLSVTDAAKALGVSRVALSELVNERRGVSPEMAIRLASLAVMTRACGASAGRAAREGQRESLLCCPRNFSHPPWRVHTCLAFVVPAGKLIDFTI
jgi:addiction module HigA family antidote